jgi:UDP-N-acetylmuramoyl-L-alanyl-D-glutamate--2,6-diaminopimelate ligase
MDGHEAGASLQSSGSNPEILGLTADSRLVEPGFLFAALPGIRQDGRRFIADAAAKGAAAILIDPEGAKALPEGITLPLLVDPNPRRALARAAAIFHAPQPAMVVAVTGTNGKTSTASFTRQIWQHAGRPAASIGTLGIETAEGLEEGALTTPDPVSLHAVLGRLKQHGIDHVAMEASSIGLDQYRLDGVTLKAAAFTNLTQDHLDYHGTMEAYLVAKLRLVANVLAADGTAVINADTPESEHFRAAATGRTVLDYGVSAKAIRLIDRRMLAEGQALELEIVGQRRSIELPLLGTFQVMNALAALGLAIGTGLPVDDALSALGHLTGVHGRIEKIVTLPNGAPVFVDYAHTPDGLEKVLMALRPHAPNRLICVFGAGGDRDPTKRPKMGAIVAQLADIVVVTDDNPRSESPALIRAAILAACPHAIEIGDRAEAIDWAMRSLAPGDLLVVAGKGHEQGQTIAGIIHPFDDSSVVRAVARRLSEAT